MTLRLLILATLGLVGVGCSGVRRSGTHGVGPSELQAWSKANAVDVLKRGIDSEDAAVRAAAFEAWIASGDSSIESVVARAAFDPSPLVQRMVAQRDPDRFSARLLERPSPDAIALGWLAANGVSVAVDGHDTESLLARAIQADDEARRGLIEEIQSGFVPADSGFFELIQQVEIEGVGAALLSGSHQAEAEVRLSMALTAFVMGVDGATARLSQLLSESEEYADQFWVVEAVVRESKGPDIRWLQSGKKSSDHALALHFHMALAALGEAPSDALVEAIKTGDRDTRAWAIECYGAWLGDRSLPREMIAILKGSARDEAESIRLAAARLIIDKLGVESVNLTSNGSDQEPDRVALLVAGEWLKKHAQLFEK